jgi:DNA-binding transcriptional MerR regulator
MERREGGCAMEGQTEILTGEAARRLKVSPERVRQLERAGVLPARKTVGGFRIYRAADVEALRRRRE